MRWIKAYILNGGSYLLGCNFKGLLSQLVDMKIMLPEFIEKLRLFVTIFPIRPCPEFLGNHNLQRDIEELVHLNMFRFRQ